MERDFVRDRFDPNVVGSGNPWETTQHEQPIVDAPAQYRRPFMSIPIVRILALILAVFFALYLLYAIFVHPVNIAKLIINNSIINPEGAVPDRNYGTAAAFKKSKSGEKKWLRR